MAGTLKLEDYTVLLLCPLEVELQAACLMLDEVHDGVHERSPGQNVLYILGKISSHNVAIAGYPAGEVGIGMSGSMASEALRDFPNLEVGLLVGIAAGIPSPTRDIRLGDVAVAFPNQGSPGVIGYDLVKIGDEEVTLKQWQNSTHSLLRAAIRRIQVGAILPGGDFTRHLHVLERAVAFKRPGPPPASSEWSSQTQNRGPSDGPQVHYGTILSGNAVIKSKKRRDELRDKYGGVAIEMEAAGVMTRLPVAVVRGISDFADSHKNDEWQPYAAITAAAYAKEMLIKLGPLRKEAIPASKSIISPNVDAHLSLALPEECRFVGREAELAELEEWLGPRRQKAPQKSGIALWGLSGVGKSQLVSEFVKKQRDKHPDCNIFWIDGESNEAFEQSIIGTLKVADGPIPTSSETCEGYHEQRNGLVASFFAELKSPTCARWLIIIDGVSSISSVQQRIRGYLGSLPCGSIILTSRSKEVADWLPRQMEVKGLPEIDAVKLLQSEIPHQFRTEKDVLDLARTLKGFPLSLRLAASVISRYPQSVAHYVKKWKKRELDYENLSTRSTLLRSLEVSFEELQNTNHLTTKLLMLFSFLDHRDMWYDLCRNAIDSEYPDWLRQIADRKRFQGCIFLLCDLSFIEAKSNGGEEYVYEIHPAIHEFSRWRAKDNEEEYVKSAVSLVAANVPRSTNKDFLAIAQRLEPHAEQCKLHMERGSAGRGLDLVELEKFGDLFRLVGRYDEACWFYKGILNILRDDEHSQPTMELMANIENNLGLVYHAQRQYGLALQAFDRSCQRRLQLQVPDEDASMSTLYNKGRCLLALSELEQAQQCFLSAARYFSDAIVYTQGPGRDGIMQLYFRVLNDLGETYLRGNDLDQAEKVLRQAFDGQKRYLHESHPATFAVRLNMGRVCVERSRFVSAHKIFQHIIAKYTEWWGRHHSETMRAVDELAHSYMKHGRTKRLMGDCGDPELKMAANLWGETLSFYQEVYGASSDIAILARSKLHDLQLFNNELDDPYREYYSESL